MREKKSQVRRDAERAKLRTVTRRSHVPSFRERDGAKGWRDEGEEEGGERDQREGTCRAGPPGPAAALRVTKQIPDPLSGQGVCGRGETPGLIQPSGPVSLVP